MNTDLTYLEFVDVEHRHHKFYEVRVTQQTVTIRYGRIHTTGTTQTKTYATPEAAQINAQKKISEKQRKGYQIVTPPSLPEPPIEPAAIAPFIPPALSAETPISPPPTTDAIVPNTGVTAPIQWRFESGSPTFGIAVDADHCWLGNEKGQVFKLDHQGTVLQQYQLPDAVKCIVVDDIWIYVGCDNGNIYDLTGKFPYLAYEVEKGIDIFWLTIFDGILAISDANGGITKTDPDGEILWTRLSPGKMGWMLCSDAQGFYHGHAKGVTLYDFMSGHQVWHQPTIGKVLFGCQTRDRIYAATSGKQIHCFSKVGACLATYHCHASVYACATDPQGNYLFAADSSAFIYCFTQAGKCLWKVATGYGSALSMQYFQDALYLVTNQGIMACLNVSAAAVQAAQTGHFPTTITVTPIASLPTATTVTTLETRSDPASGVILECIRQGQQLRVRAITEGYRQDWMVQFPKDLRREGDRYWVQSLKVAKQGGYYRTYGEIKRLV